MVRELIEIEAAGDGWLVRSGGTCLVCVTKLQAIERAHALAERRYAETGCPTGVRVPVAGDVRLILGTCG
ncbi:hypothetical protein QFW80_15825 [Luteimonas sp. M1R5S18]|jgi:hypothetical protein|uniref:Uncharacterized protein n=1 Tax=Luteimonas rhizosphaericola TaxID=3042024 RepID=A0ABT6JMT5_9GAMM|nr:hypothetical protein [Luteimonas rhizosphaericola]MDH5831986.1 hypothetical protein [Luteimonas rhizosphaericola]